MTHNESNAPDKPAETLADMGAAYNYADLYQMMESIRKMQKNDRKKSRKRKRKEAYS